MTAPNRRGDGKPTVIKKYANRRLYDTGRSSYVTLEDLCEMVKEGRDFVVYDAKTNEDLTHAVLTQIIVEQEGRGQNLLPIPFLRQLIGFYGDNLQTLVPNYLEQSLGAFTQNQAQFREQMGKSLGDIVRNPITALEEMNRKNMEMFQTAMQTWTKSFTGGGAAAAAKPDPDARARELKDSIAKAQAELDKLGGK